MGWKKDEIRNLHVLSCIKLLSECAFNTYYLLNSQLYHFFEQMGENSALEICQGKKEQNNHG